MLSESLSAHPDYRAKVKTIQFSESLFAGAIGSGGSRAPAAARARLLRTSSPRPGKASSPTSTWVRQSMWAGRRTIAQSGICADHRLREQSGRSHYVRAIWRAPRPRPRQLEGEARSIRRADFKRHHDRRQFQPPGGRGEGGGIAAVLFRISVGAAIRDAGVARPPALGPPTVRSPGAGFQIVVRLLPNVARVQSAGSAEGARTPNTLFRIELRCLSMWMKET